MRHLTDAALPAQIAEVLSRHDVPSGMLTLEVTESTVMSDPLQAAAILAGLRELGVRIALDDYGVGYCSLAYLCRLEVDGLKIDRSLVQAVMNSSSDELVVRSTIALAHDLGLKVVGEGVEDEHILTRLAELNCDVAQGYYFAQPLPAAQLQSMLDDSAASSTPTPSRRPARGGRTPRSRPCTPDRAPGRPTADRASRRRLKAALRCGARACAAG